MKNIKKISLIGIILMTGLSFTNLWGFKITGLTVIVGVLYFFITKEKDKNSGFEIKNISTNLKTKNIFLWIALPLIMDAISIIIAKVFLPEYLEHVFNRTEGFISFDKILILVFQLIFLALMEEIAWRAFFQKHLTKFLPIGRAILISSILFAIAHISSGSPVLVIYDILFIFINSILYGIIFYKTNNAWVSGISHFIANLFSIIVLMLL